MGLWFYYNIDRM